MVKLMEYSTNRNGMKKIDKIYFLLPGTEINENRECVPVGGYKVIYEYANMFASDGYNVIIAYSHARCHYKNPLKYIYTFLGFYYRKFRGQLRAGTYFSFNKNVHKLFCYRFSFPWLTIEHNAIVFATAYETAKELNQIKSIPQSQKYYFIQGYELWAADEEQLKESYRFGMKNIVIAPWLKEKVQEAGAKAICLTNGFNFKEFQLTIPFNERDKYHVVMLNHILEHKRCIDAWNALKIVKEVVPQLHVTMFGVYPFPEDLPSWYSYHKNPSKSELNNIYNQGAIYVAASDFEGFGLTVGEAMICGCAVACTNNGGFTCMAKNEQTALVSDIYDVNALAENIKRLILDDNLRFQIAKNGNDYIQNFTWESSFNKLKQQLK